jgi:drug/metabolite transporter (DMT)-like permease
VWIVARTNPTFASTWTYISPFIALFVGAALLHEPLTPLSLAGGVVVVAGCVMLNRELLRRITARQPQAEREAA